MERAHDMSFGSAFERTFVGLIAIATALVLIFLAVQGPLLRGAITYKTDPTINNQLVGQDAVNIGLMSPLLILGGIGLFLRKRWAKDLLIATPLFLIYYAISYTVGWEWSSSTYTRTSERYFFYFLFVFAGMWVQEVRQVITTGTTRGYDLYPTGFWLIRVFDLGFSIPLGLITVYLLWARPGKAFPIVSLFYGFFFTQIIAVNAMGWMMFVKKDPAFLWRDLIVFSVLALIILFGYFYVRRNYKAG